MLNTRGHITHPNMSFSVDFDQKVGYVNLLGIVGWPNVPPPADTYIDEPQR
jgi:hypothetical protein